MAVAEPLLLALTTVDTIVKLYTKAQTLFCCGFVANLFVQYVDNKSNQWSLSLTVHVRANN